MRSRPFQCPPRPILAPGDTSSSSQVSSQRKQAVRDLTMTDKLHPPTHLRALSAGDGSMGVERMKPQASLHHCLVFASAGVTDIRRHDQNIQESSSRVCRDRLPSGTATASSGLLFKEVEQAEEIGRDVALVANMRWWSSRHALFRPWLSTENGSMGART